MASAPPVGRGFSPLDDELALLPGSLAPSLVESAVRLGTYIPFEPAAAMLAHFTKVEVGEDTVRRMTERAGKAYVALQTAELERLERESPVSPLGPAVQQLSVDGAMVPLLHREWAEVKTLAIGVVDQRLRDGKLQAYTRETSYFSRMADYMSFARASTVETYRRGTARAGLVLGIADGADWEQVFLDLHRADAIRILDWAHALDTWQLQPGRSSALGLPRAPSGSVRSCMSSSTGILGRCWPSLGGLPRTWRLQVARRPRWSGPAWSTWRSGRVRSDMPSS